MRQVDDCETALAAHWCQLGRLPGGRVHAGDRLVWFETPVRQLPYNGVVRTRLTDADADAAIAAVLARVRGRGADLWWVEHPSATPADLGARLARAGLQPVERMNFMALELGAWRSPAPARGVEVELVAGAAAARDYARLTLAYWEVSPEERDAVLALEAAGAPGRDAGARFLVRAGGRAVAKAQLALAAPPGVASIYGMTVVPDARGRGIASALTATMLAHARERGCHRAVLHATDAAVGVYRRVGFEPCATVPVHATTALWAGASRAAYSNGATT